MKARETCPVCDSNFWIELDRRSNIPIAQNLVFHDRQSAIDCRVGQLRLLRCRRCGFSWNALFDPALMKYDATYDNDQNFSAAFRAHVDSIAARVAGVYPDRWPLTVLDIGCGQGSFLAALAQHPGAVLAKAVGFDPAWRGNSELLPLNVEVIGDYFTPETAGRVDIDPCIAISRHTIEHVPDPISFLATIRAACRPGAMVLIETPNVDWILEKGMFCDFFYEHCSLFNSHSLAYAMESVGFEAVSIEPVFDRQYMLAIGRVAASKGRPEMAFNSAGFTDLGYGDRRDTDIQALRQEIMSASEEVAFALWGGASKGVTVALMLDAERDRIKCAIDINPRKQNCFLPGTGISILSPEAAYASGVRTALILNPNYAAEIRQYCRYHSLDMVLLTL